MGSTENVEFYRSQIILARTEIKNLRQQLAALKHEYVKETRHIKESLKNLRCGKCVNEATTSVPNGHSEKSSPQSSSNTIEYNPIGHIETSFTNKRAVPRQPALNNVTGAIVIDSNVFNNPEHALSGLEEFSHLWIIFHFHMTSSSNVLAKVSPPRLQGERRGVLSTRSPHRPCPIGLSLVKIHAIEDNKIYFIGVDMVNQTPVLDIKPYIPQYDNPACYVTDGLTTLQRPPTEGVSDVVDGANARLSPRISNSLNINTTSPLDEAIRSPAAGDTIVTPISPNLESPSDMQCEGDTMTPMRRPDCERGAPDGQERFTPPQSTNQIAQALEGVRVASWISNPPSQRYRVQFTTDAAQRLHELIGDRADAFRTHIENLLCEDPRSNYVRTRYPDHEYSCVLEDLSVCCVFNVETSTCTIVAVRNADEMQQQ